MAHIRKLDTGRYQARYRDPDDHKERAKNALTKEAAQRWLDEKTAGLVRGDYADPQAGKAKVRDIAERWYATTAILKPSTRQSYRSLLDEHVLPRWGEVELRRLTHSGIAIWTAELSVSRSASTTRKALGVLRQVLALAVADRRLAINPANGVAQPRLPLAEQRFLDPSELLRLATAMPSERDRMLALVLGWTGLRFGEAAALVRDDLDLLRRRIRVERAVAEVRGVLHVGTPKQHAVRSVAIPPSLADELGHYIGGLSSIDRPVPLFPSKTSGYIRVTTWKRRVFDRAARSAGLTPPLLRVHDLRHTAASLAIASGASVKLVQRQLGHKSATLTLDTYSHLFADDLDALSNALEGLRFLHAADSLRTPEAPANVVALADLA
jgi:integrase